MSALPVIAAIAALWIFSVFSVAGWRYQLCAARGEKIFPFKDRAVIAYLRASGAIVLTGILWAT